ncbi:MAG: tetratricopeptide repeat protein, partial [Paludibacteraceae bacterium]|nr:tetratricopeptide repeat protein [Paludibacteraceae bacterium]
NCIELFDENKLKCLFRFCQSPHTETAMRALIGVILCLLLYKDRYSLYPSINNLLQELMDNETMVSNAQNIVKQLIRSKETDKITQDIQQNILPTITKIAPQIHKEITSDTSFDTDHYEDEQHNWQEMLEDSGIQDKIESYAQMQRDGSDINLSTFAQMKVYPFFQQFENWLLPFDTAHESLKELFATMSVSEPVEGPDIEEPNSTNGLEKLLSLTHFLCDSDKYSFCFNLQMIPSDYRKSMVEQIKMGDEQIKDIEKPSSQVISNLYLQDLYRFYTLCKSKDFFTNPFLLDVNVHETSFFRFLNPEGKFIAQLADFFFAKEQYNSALTAYLKSKEQGATSNQLYQKLGYCYQKNEQYAQAIQYYEKADLLDNADIWTYRKLAYCHRMLKEYEKALFYYEQVDLIKPDDLNVIFNIGVCHAELGDYKKALNAFYKIEFLQSDMSKSIYYHLYMAHCLWATGDKKAALERYALFPHDQLAEQLENACITLSDRDKVYVVDYLRYS